MKRRDFLQLLAAIGLVPKLSFADSVDPADALYKLPEFGNTRLLHISDCHAQLLPMYYREPSINLGLGTSLNQPPYLTGSGLLQFFGIPTGSRAAYAFSDVDFVNAAKTYGKMGGFAHLATLVKQLRGQSGAENTLLLDSGDTWQGSATALWTSGQDMLAACNLLGVEVMTGHWEFTYGAAQVVQNISQFSGNFVAQNIALSEEAQFAAGTENPEVFQPYLVKNLKNARIAVIGQAFPYTPVANPAWLIPDWHFGIEETKLQKLVEKIKASEKVDVIVLLSHNGIHVDLKLATNVSGIDIILGGHTHDALPRPFVIKNSGGQTWVTNAGSHGKFLAVLDLEVNNGKLGYLRYQLMPVFANLLAADFQMQTLIDGQRQPFLSQLRQPLAFNKQLLYRRDTFHGSFDDIFLKALLTVNDAQIAFSPGFRWGTTVLPNEILYLEDLMNHCAITYPNTYVQRLTGAEIKAILEDVADNLFNPDPYLQQGGDMVRVAGMTYKMNPAAKTGERISEMRLPNGKLLQAKKKYKVSGWASLNANTRGKPIWDIASEYLLAKQVIE